MSYGRLPTIRFATFNASLYREQDGELRNDLSTPRHPQIQAVAEIIQRTAPDILLINEFDFDALGKSAHLFAQNYLEIPQNGSAPIQYPYFFLAPTNTGVQSGFDLNRDGVIGGPQDALGFGTFPGQYGMIVYSRYPILHHKIRTFQTFLWGDMPGALLPDDLETPEPDDWYSGEMLQHIRLSSKSHWDVPIQINNHTIYFLVSHPTPPVFDGPEGRNSKRNHDEIRFWADYLLPHTSPYIYDDAGRFGGLPANAHFVIAGDLNADPHDGDSVNQAILQLLNHPSVNTAVTPTSPGALEAVHLRYGSTDLYQGDPAHHTATFQEAIPGNLRVDYVLPSKSLEIVDTAVFWPTSLDPLYPLVLASSDHRLVWIDVQPTPLANQQL